MADRSQTPVLEWIAAALGILVTLTMLTVIGHDAIEGSGGQPVLAASPGEVSRTPAGNVVTFTVANRAPAAAASVEVEGILSLPDRAPESSSATLDYVAGRSRANGALVFAGDPAAGRLALTVRGWSEP